jgi:uncharacterized protein (TIGR01440 family)
MSEEKMIEEIKRDLEKAVRELLGEAKLNSGDILVAGCSTSEVAGHNIGTASSEKLGSAIFDTVYSILKQKGIYLAAQCCEHLNRAIIIPREAAAARGLETVNVVPHPKAGGSFATAAYNAFENPVAVEAIKADAGMDIGNTLIGMHLKSVAIPLRLSVSSIGKACLVCAKTRPKYIGGSRACYDERMT